MRSHMTTKGEAFRAVLAALEQIQSAMPFPSAVNAIKTRRPQKDEQKSDYKALLKQMCARCDYLDKIAHELQTLCDVQALRLGEHENRQPLTDGQIKGLIEEGVFFGNCKEIVRAIEAAHGIGATHDKR